MIIIISSRLFHTQYVEGFYVESLSRFIGLLKITAMLFISITIIKKNKLDFAPVQ